MDQSLLQSRDAAQSGAASEQPDHTNNEESVTVGHVEEQQFRDLAIEKPVLPLRVLLDPPIEFDGEKFEKLVLDFESMTGKDFQRAEREFTHLYKTDRNEAMPLPEMKHLYHAIIAKNLANVPLGVIYKLPRRVYVPLRLEVLKACGSSPEEEKA
jgi:hypothetical protein